MSSASKKKVNHSPRVTARFTNTAGLYGLLGWPAKHSLSPLMHNSAFRDLDLDAIYLPFEVAPEDLQSALGGLAASGFKGLNLTVPHKEAAIPFLDSSTERATQNGAVNTLSITENGWRGDNTDGLGYLNDLKLRTGLKIAGKRVVCLGAGGAARGVLMEMGRQKAKEVAILNSIPEQSRKILDDLEACWPKTQWRIGDWNQSELEEALPNADILLNCTPCGMEGVPPLPFHIEKAQPKCVVSDVIYIPAVTPLLAEAKRRKLITHSGLGMLIGQGALAFEIWTGKKMPVDKVRLRLLRALRENRK